MNIFWKTALKKQKKQQENPDQGFITIEIIVSLLIATLFVLGSLQMLVVGAAMSVGATRQQRADKIIQQEIENLNNLGGTLALPTTTTVITGTTISNPTISTCNGSIDLDNNGTADDGFGQALWNMRKATNPTSADALVAANNTPILDTDTTIMGRTLEVTITRNTDAGDLTLTPHRILGLTLLVAEDQNGDGDTDDTNEEIAERYVEVIPDAALECP